MARPQKLHDVIRTDTRGNDVTVEQEIVRLIELGLEWNAAAQQAGVAYSTVAAWRADAGKARARRAAGASVTPNQANLIAFLEAVETAQVTAEARRLAVIQRATEPHEVIKETIKVDADGKLIERTTVTERRPGAWQPAAWWLERRMPERYARRFEVTGAGGGPVQHSMEDRAEQLATELRAFLEAGQRSLAEDREQQPAAE